MKLLTKNLISILPILLFILIIIFSFTETSYAVPAAPSPTCAIDATVLNIQKVKTNIRGLGQPPREDFYYYAVKLKIHNSSTYQQEGYGSCDNLINSEKDSILHLSEYDKSPIKAGQKINAKIKFGGDEWFGGYFLSDIKIITTELDETVQIKSSTEISTLLLDQKQVGTIESIELSNQRYNIIGYRSAKLFGFIPVKLRLKLTVDPITGNVESIKSPWWSFLAR